MRERLAHLTLLLFVPQLMGGHASPGAAPVAVMAAALPGNATRLAASFAPFRPHVRTFWDDTYFYVESEGLPNAALMPEPMVGITSWQQQIPLPTSYFLGTTNPERNAGSAGYGQPNVWRIPLVPVPAAQPLPLSGGNFQRGAVAIGVDGIPIFNPRNNRGEFSQAVGELDHYGGHVGLADDFHYHIAPLHLASVGAADMPVAWALDGYPIYGYLEPDGAPRQPLDADGGHDHGAYGYHYHAIGSAAAGPQPPYLMNAFHGTVGSFGGQVDPQPSVAPIRAQGTGGYSAKQVPGAVITAYKHPVALATDSAGHLVEASSGVPSDDAFLMRYRVGSTTYDIGWLIDRQVNPKAVTVTWRLPNLNPTTTRYANRGNRITAYPVAGRSMVRLPDTGQTIDATTTFGEDSDYAIHPPSFTDHGDGTVTDNVTGLMWQKVDSGEMTWDRAVAAAGRSATAGYRDWRLPTTAEALSILNYNRSPALDEAIFATSAGGMPDYWWTSDTYGADATRVWVTNAGGGLGPHPASETISAGGTHRIHARYVRGARPTNGHNYANHNNGTVTDLDTGLMWATTPSARLTWQEALAFAEGLSLAGYDDWRLPNIKELQSLVDVTLATATRAATVPSVNRLLFPAVAATAHWSSTAVRGRTAAQAWLVEFGVHNAVPAASGPPRGFQGIVSYEAMASSYPVLAVRTAEACDTRYVTQGRATAVTANLLPTTARGSRVSAVGRIAATDGTTWTVPAATAFKAGPKASDLYNEVTGVTPAGIAAVDVQAVPIVEVDPDGELIVGYLFADNYFELYVNGTRIAVDPVPYTPFNSSIVRFRAKRPITYAVRLVDWEENLGLGTEVSGGDTYHPGDGGFMASFSDGTVTDGRWKAQSFYIAPLDDGNAVTERPDGTHDSSAVAPTHARHEDAFALHYRVPPDWFAPSYDACPWPFAKTYAEATVGVDNKPAYTNFPAQFSRSGAQFIWSSNLVLDNEVIVRFTGPPHPTEPPASSATPSTPDPTSGPTVAPTSPATPLPAAGRTFLPGLLVRVPTFSSPSAPAARSRRRGSDHVHGVEPSTVHEDVRTSLGHAAGRDLVRCPE